jgi:hypothetical protein
VADHRDDPLPHQRRRDRNRRIGITEIVPGHQFQRPSPHPARRVDFLHGQFGRPLHGCPDRIAERPCEAYANRSAAVTTRGEGEKQERLDLDDKEGATQASEHVDSMQVRMRGGRRL